MFEEDVTDDSIFITIMDWVDLPVIQGILHGT